MQQYISQIIQLAITLVLIRLLRPEDFGLLAMVTVFTGYAWLFLDMGFSSAIVQKKASFMTFDDDGLIFRHQVTAPRPD